MKLARSTAKKQALHSFEVSDDQLDAFLATVILGTLQAMRSGVWSLDAGIWTLGRPIFRAPLEKSRACADLVEILQQADELSALEAMSGRSVAEAEIDKMIANVQRVLAKNSEQFWRVCVSALQREDK